MEFKPGTVIKLENGNKAIIEKKLGAGGQGCVYRVTVDGRPYALKWYTCRLQNKTAFKKNLQDNIAAGSPDEMFVWPLCLAEEMNNGSFGYIMELIPKEYTQFCYILKGKKDGRSINFSSDKAIVTAALNIVHAFRSLHRIGLSYQDVNDGAFFFNIQTGDVRIVDNDNITPGGLMNPGNIGGKPGYMAPEVFTGKDYPGVLSDRHSLAVILFKLLCRHDPMMGRAYVESVCITEERELELYGTRPVFIFDKCDTSNRPVKGIHENPIKIWPLLPDYIQEAFVTTFCDGLKNPNARLPDNEWHKKLLRYLDELLVCPICGDEYWLGKFEPGKQMKFACKHTFSYPHILQVQNYLFPLFPGTKLLAHHINHNVYDYLKVEGTVIMNKNNPNLWGIKNVGSQSWLFTIPGGQTKEIENKSVLPIAIGEEINFGNVTGKVIK